MVSSASPNDVLEIENVESVGTRFAVRSNSAAAKRSCDFGEVGADYVVGGEDEPLWFAGITSRYLVMTRSTGPQGDIVTYDLDQRKIHLDVAADEVDMDESGATYWERIADGTVDNCPEYAEYQSSGLGAAISQAKRFDFACGKVETIGPTRCDAIQ
jgi:hypothetical protein